MDANHFLIAIDFPAVKILPKGVRFDAVYLNSNILHGIHRNWQKIASEIMYCTVTVTSPRRDGSHKEACTKLAYNQRDYHTRSWNEKIHTKMGAP
jgi:hypothetical protein